MKIKSLTVTKIFELEMAHMLEGHKGACRHLHGHSYKLEISVGQMKELLTNDMVVDFSHLKSIVNQYIVDSYDHAFLYYKDTGDKAEKAFAETAKTNFQKTVELEGRPTAENLCLQMAKVLEAPLTEAGISLVRLRLWETSSSFAEVTLDE